MFAISDGGVGNVEVQFAGTTQRTSVNFHESPNGELHAAGEWQKLATVHADQAGTITVKVTSDGGQRIAFDAILATRPLLFTDYVWDHRSRLARETITETREGGVGGQLAKRVIDYGYDALDRLVSRTETVMYPVGTVTATHWTGYAYDGNSRLLEFAEQQANGTTTPKITRAWFTNAATGQVMAVNDAPASSDVTTTFWTFADMTGTVRSVARVDDAGWHVLHRDFTDDGRPKSMTTQLRGEDTDALLVNAPILWNGLVYDDLGWLYHTPGAGNYEPLSARSLVDRGGENGYIMFANAPTAPPEPEGRLEALFRSVSEAFQLLPFGRHYAANRLADGVEQFADSFDSPFLSYHGRVSTLIRTAGDMGDGPYQVQQAQAEYAKYKELGLNTYGSVVLVAGRRLPIAMSLLAAEEWRSGRSLGAFDLNRELNGWDKAQRCATIVADLAGDVALYAGVRPLFAAPSAAPILLRAAEAEPMLLRPAAAYTDAAIEGMLAERAAGSLSEAGGAVAGDLAGDAASFARKLTNAYAGVRQASDYLRSMGVARADRVRILQSFEPGNMVVRQAGPSEFGLRYFSDPTRTGGSYLFETFPASRASLAMKLQWNTMSGFRQFQVRPGATILEGRTAAQGPYLPGGQIQKFILDWRSDFILP